MTWLRLVAVLAYVSGFFFAWQCWSTANVPAKAIGWLGAASAAFWVGRITSRVARTR